jgi:hypothetical protein
MGRSWPFGFNLRDSLVQPQQKPGVVKDPSRFKVAAAATGDNQAVTAA